MRDSDAENQVMRLQDRIKKQKEIMSKLTTKIKAISKEDLPKELNADLDELTSVDLSSHSSQKMKLQRKNLRRQKCPNRENHSSAGEKSSEFDLSEASERKSGLLKQNQRAFPDKAPTPPLSSERISNSNVESSRQDPSRAAANPTPTSPGALSKQNNRKTPVSPAANNKSPLRTTSMKKSLNKELNKDIDHVKAPKNLGPSHGTVSNQLKRIASIDESEENHEQFGGSEDTKHLQTMKQTTEGSADLS